MDWLEAARQLRLDGQPGVLVTVAEVRGHAPREAGAKMVVSRDRTWGSVGGGNLEASAVARARELIESGATEPELRETRLSPHARTEHGRQCCGGVVRLLLEPLAARTVIAVFGLGHVGYELARILSRLPVRLLLTDSRAEQLDRVRLADVIDGVADVGVHHTLLGEYVLEQLPRGAHVMIMTHDHAEDFALCDAALRLPQPLGSIGLIGSSAKWARFAAQLAAAGHGPEAIARITCPIGQPGITGKDPAIIAVAVASALLQTLPADHLPASHLPASHLPASQRGAALPGLRSDGGATREGSDSRRPGGERENRASGKTERPGGERENRASGKNL